MIFGIFAFEGLVVLVILAVLALVYHILEEASAKQRTKEISDELARLFPLPDELKHLDED